MIQGLRCLFVACMLCYYLVFGLLSTGLLVVLFVVSLYMFSFEFILCKIVFWVVLICFTVVNCLFYVRQFVMLLVWINVTAWFVIGDYFMGVYFATVVCVVLCVAFVLFWHLIVVFACFCFCFNL